MRILVMSDCHGEISAARTALYDQTQVSDVIFLGDGAADIEELSADFPEKKFHIVCGNCDFFSPFPDRLIIKLGGKTIFACHGHTYHVKYGHERAVGAAAAAGCDILLFGHTHKAMTDYENGLYIMNPGSLSASGDHSYGFIDITSAGIAMNIVSL